MVAADAEELLDGIAGGEHVAAVGGRRETMVQALDVEGGDGAVVRSSCS